MADVQPKNLLSNYGVWNSKCDNSIDNNSLNAAVTDWATAGDQLHSKNADVQQNLEF